MLTNLKILSLLLGLCSCAVVSKIQGPSEKWVEGTLVEVVREEDYEQPCRLFCKLTGRGKDFPRAYSAVVLGNGGKETYFMFFALEGNIIPKVGQMGYWKLMQNEVVVFSKCSSYSCPKEITYTLESLSDYRAID